MSCIRIISISAGVVLAWPFSWAGELKNGSFEQPFGPPEEQAVWGDVGETFGEAYRVDAGSFGNPDAAKDGVRCVQLDVLSESWNGIWQQQPCQGGGSVHFEGHYLIRGGNLPPGIRTLLKIEFFNEAETQISAVEGAPRTEDTGGQWVADQVDAVAPVGTTHVRYVMIAGTAEKLDAIRSRIFWDAASIGEAPVAQP